MPYIETPQGRIFIPDQPPTPQPNRINTKNMKVLCYDLGLWTENCLRLVRDVAEVKYYVPNREAFQQPFRDKIGDGFEGMERIDDEKGDGEGFEKYLDWADLIFIPDNVCASLVEFLKAKQYPVCGMGSAERLEIDRSYWMDKQKQLGLPEQEKIRVKGVTALLKFCKENNNYYIKVPNGYRNIEESFMHAGRFSDVETTILRIAYKLGPYKEDIVFICEEELEGPEPGIDAITFAGELLFPTMGGYEKCGVGIIERVYRDELELPRVYKMVDEALAPEFAKHDTRFFYSTELIGKYVLDLTLRLAGPGTAAIQSELIENYTEVIAGLALGIKIEPTMKHKYAAACAFHSTDAMNEWVSVYFPKDMCQWVKLRMACKKNGEYYAVPGFENLGTVIGFGNSLKEVIDLVSDRMKEVKAKRLDPGIENLVKIQKDIEEGRQAGIPF